MNRILTLKDKRILVTREKSQAKDLSREIALRGGIPIEVPLLRVNCQFHKGDQPIWDRLNTYEWIFFTSANGVKCFFNKLKSKSNLTKYIYHQSIAAIGHKTEKELKKYNISADFIPTIYDAKTLGREFLEKHPNIKGPILLVQGNKSLRILPTVFSKKNIPFDCLLTYATEENKKMEKKLTSVLQNDKIDILTFTSPSIVDTFMKFTKGRTLDQDKLIACIGTTTEKRAREFGFTKIVVPEEFTIEGMLRAIENYIQN